MIFTSVGMCIDRQSTISCSARTRHRMPAETPPYRNRDSARLVREIPFQAEPALRDPQLGLVSAIDQPKSCQLENAAVKKDDCPKAGQRQFQTCEAPSRTAAYKNSLFHPGSPSQSHIALACTLAATSRVCGDRACHSPRCRGTSEGRHNRFSSAVFDCWHKHDGR
ncbi:hypothetical protein [Mesorhizobium sp. SARCC-RB16n]|uniref:hypothetical protein n=1 Tax=Mesorhizobium sp. SARCC-RB16n TaxID=2116687 RepID=UPI00122EBDDD|nr:hypothetical protein [Mesorhizobium sp. SARCC-RB16n]